LKRQKKKNRMNVLCEKLLKPKLKKSRRYIPKTEGEKGKMDVGREAESRTNEQELAL